MKNKFSVVAACAAIFSLTAVANDTTTTGTSMTNGQTTTQSINNQTVTSTNAGLNKDLPVSEGGLTRDAETVRQHCGVGNYLFRNETDCARTAMTTETTTQSAAVQAPIDRDTTLFFDTDHSAIVTEHLSELSSTIEFLQAHPNAKVEISGYADATGTETYNERLAQRRAQALRDHLLKANIPSSQVAIVTPADPVSDTPDNRADRKVELRLEPMLAE